MFKKVKNLIIVFIVMIASFAVAHFALALDLGLSYGEAIGLKSADPRVIIVNIIRVALGFLSIIAVIIIMYGGWLWMTAGGDSSKVDKAKKVLIGAIIGLIIILSSFAITSFVVSKISESAISGSPALTCDAGNVGTCNGCQRCIDLGGGSYGWVADSTCSGCTLDPFIVTAIQPTEAFCPATEENTTIRNVIIRIYFNKNVDPSSVDSDSIVIQGSNTQCPAGTLAPIAGDFTVNGAVVEFKPAVGTCPDNPCNADRCFDANSTIDIEVMTSGPDRVTTGGGAEQVQDNLTLNENTQFFTNDLIDCQNPTVILNSSTQVCLDAINDLGSVSSDDSGVSQIEFSDDNGSLAFIGGTPTVVVPCPGPGICGLDPETWILPLGTVQWQPTVADGYSAGTNYTITAAANDLDNNTASDSQTFNLRPAHCCNGELDDAGDPDLLEGPPEEGADCGGECAACAGAACGTSMSDDCSTMSIDCGANDSLCSSGFCDCINPGDTGCQDAGYDTGITNCCLCQDKPVIDWVSPIGGFCDGDINTFCVTDDDCSAFTTTTCNIDTPNGAVGNFVVIGGRNFGITPGTVYFSDGIGGWVQAFLADNDANGGNSDCGSDVWKDEQIIAVVPSGAANGPIRVMEATTGNNYFDDSNDFYGQVINDFTVNNIDRPGLCRLDPDHGIMDESINYYGIKLSGSAAYFGDLAAGYIGALNSNFPNELQGQAQVPNIQTGKTTSFVIKSGVNGNYLTFTKDPEPVTGPVIISFEPTQGNIGQYVTIYGSGFGKLKETSKVFFGDEVTGTEASYDFPDVCSDSVWSDGQVIVKVPEGLTDGSYTLTMVIGSWIINTDNVSPSKFTVDTSLTLAPSLCKIQPIMGPNNSEIALWGEYFGSESTGLIRFYLNRDQSGTAITYWGLDGNADKAETTVHQNAVSGPVRVVQGGIEGNGINFTIGLCTEAPSPDDACGSDICCPIGSYEEGKCKASIDDCYPVISSSVYEWDFNTGNILGVGTPCYDPATDIGNCSPLTTEDCSSFGLECNPNSCTCQPPDVESCMGYGQGECGNNFCPNSPGQCSFYAGGNPVVVGSCNDSICDGLGACTVPPCTYNNNLNRCDNGSACDLPKTIQDVLGNDITAYCAEYEGTGRWHIDINTSCPSGWINIGGGKCIEDGTTCNFCNSGFACLDQGGSGVCAIDQEICPSGSVCNTVDECEKTDESVCECCCRIEFAAEDCCAPLDCTGTCGNDVIDDSVGFGHCTGCANAGTTQAEHDNACNCLGHSGKYCDTDDVDYPEGICRDCTQLSTPTQCSLHSTACCIDAMDGDSCQGGDGTLLPGGFCAYYNCETNQPYSCLGPEMTGNYKTNDCNSECGPPEQLGGLSCYNSEDDLCNITCGTGYTCLGDTGCIDDIGPPPAGCGSGDDSCLCCCDPNNDECGLINPDLVCTPNSDPCTGSERGLCCGCKQDDDCGDLNNIGCGLDSCCRARPGVDSNYPLDEDDPEYNSEEICRNTVIKAVFNQEMDITSFSGNVVVAGDYGSEQCPAGTQFLAKDINLDNQSRIDKNIFVRIFSKALRAFKRLLKPISHLAKAYIAPQSDRNYCAVNGTVSGYNNAADKGVLIFSPSQLLDVNRRYYVIIKGDGDITDDVSEGVLNSYNISMNGPSAEQFNAKNYTNAYIWSFETSDKICELSYIAIDPSSYLFQTANNTKVFQAYPKSNNGQDITPIAGIYNWSWSWSSDNTSVAIVTNSDNSQQTVTSQNVQDSKTFIKAIANITEDVVMSPSSVGQTKEGEAQVYVFLCENPWPPVSASGIWEPWEDNDINCTILDGGCFDTSYEFYYCRDAGGEGTADDFPAILSGIGDTIIRGSSTAQNILKEFYFLREETPTVISSLSVIDDEIGGSITATWSAVTDPDVTGYKLYWGTNSGNYDNYKDVGLVTFYNVDGLTNNTIYYFNLTSYYDTGAESDYYGEVDVIPTDSTPPAIPANLTAVAGDSQVELNWDANTDDTISYNVYYGTSPGIYGNSENVGDATSAIVTGLTNGEFYYFAVTALDSYNNESGYSDEEENMPFAVPTDLIAVATGDTEVELSWNTADGAVNYNIYYGTTSGDYSGPNPVGDVTTWTVDGLTANTTYYFVVTSENSFVDESEYSNEANATTFP